MILVKQFFSWYSWSILCIWQIDIRGLSWIALHSELELKIVLPVLRRPSQGVQTEICCMHLSVSFLYTIYLNNLVLSFQFPVMTVSICREKYANIFNQLSFYCTPEDKHPQIYFTCYKYNIRINVNILIFITPMDYIYCSQKKINISLAKLGTF